MDFIFEIVLQFVFQMLAELLFEVGFKASAKALRSRIGRTVGSALAGFAFGVWWGAHLADQGNAHRPRLLWVTIVLTVFALAATWRRTRRSADITDVGVFVAPWRWPTGRWVTFAVLNSAIALGIVTGWHPPVLR